LSEDSMPDPHGEDDATRAIAHLPGLDIEIMHRRLAGAEQISIHLQAMPSFEAFGLALEVGNPFAFWAEAARLMWLPFLPWLRATQTLMPPEHVSDAPPMLPEG
jgi:hypothetical protein